MEEYESRAPNPIYAGYRAMLCIVRCEDNYNIFLSTYLYLVFSLFHDFYLLYNSYGLDQKIMFLSWSLK